MSIEMVRALAEEEDYELPEPQTVLWEEAKEIYRGGTAVEQAAWFVMGYAASCVEFTFGEGSLKRFAYEVDKSYSTVKDQRRVYQRLMRLNKDSRLSLLRAVKNGFLAYSSLLISNPLPDDEEYVEVLEHAQDNGWGKRELAEEVAHRRSITPAHEPEDPDVPEEAAWVEVEEEEVEGDIIGIKRIVRAAAQEYVVEYANGSRERVLQRVLVEEGWRHCPHCGGLGLAEGG